MDRTTDDAHDQRDAGAVDQRGQDVAALVVGAQQVFGAAACRPRGGSRASLSSSVGQVKRVVRRDQPAKAEQNTQMKAIAAAMMATGDVRKL
jgi:hypothetical protein